MQKNHITSHISIGGLFVIVMLILTIPLVLLTSSKPQDIRQHAAELPVPIISPTPPQEFGYISGYVYYDQNQDGQRDYREAGAQAIQIKVTEVKKNPDQLQTSETVYNVTDENGYFKYPLSHPQSDMYTDIVELVLPKDYKTIDTNPHIFSNIENSSKQILEFGIFPIQTVNALRTTRPLPTKDVPAGTSPKAR